MKKCYLIIIILLSLFCFDVYAKDVCDLKQIKIEDVSVKEKSDNTIEVSNAEFKDNKLSVDLKMFDVGDFIEYKIKLKNTSTDDFYFDSNLLNIDSNYFDYSISYQDNSNKIESNKEKNVFIKIKYKKEVEKEKFYGAKFIDNRNVILNISNKNIFFTNPLTGSNNILIIIIVYLIIIGTLLYLFKFKKSKISLFVIIGLTILLPMHAIADCKYSIDIDSNVIVGKVKPHPCYFDGELVPGAEFRDGDFIYRYKQEYYEDKTDWKLKWRNIEEDGWGVIHKDIDSEVEGEIAPVMCTTINDKPIVSMSYTFYYMPNIIKLDVSNIDTSNVTNMNSTFYGVGEDIGPNELNGEPIKMSIVGLDSFDTSKVKTMEDMFFGVGRFSGDTIIEGLSTWDTSSVETMKGMFTLVAQGGFHISSSVFEKQDSTVNIGDISNWDVSNVKDMSFMFEDYGETVNNLKLDFTNWDVSNVVNFEGMFECAGGLSDTIEIIGLDTWNVSSGKNFSYMFCCLGEYAESVIIDNVTNWNMSQAETISDMFLALGRIKGEHVEIGKVTNWDTSKVVNMSYAFARIGSKSKILDIGTLNVYANDVSAIFEQTANIKAVLNIYSENPKYYNGYYQGTMSAPSFKEAATTPNSLITVNYSKNTTNIDDIIATKSDNSNVVKGKLLD